jgi:hypothetical protein
MVGGELARHKLRPFSCSVKAFPFFQSTLLPPAFEPDRGPLGSWFGQGEVRALFFPRKLVVWKKGRSSQGKLGAKVFSKGNVLVWKKERFGKKSAREGPWRPLGRGLGVS